MRGVEDDGAGTGVERLMVDDPTMLNDPSIQSMRAVSVTVDVMWKCPAVSTL